MTSLLATGSQLLLLDGADLLDLLVGTSLHFYVLDALSRSCLGLLSHGTGLHVIVQGVAENDFLFFWFRLLFFLNLFLLLGLSSSLFLDIVNFLGSFSLWHAIIESATLLVGTVWFASPVSSAKTTFLFIRFSCASAGARLPIVWMITSGLALEATALLFGWVKDYFALFGVTLRSASSSSVTSASASATSIAIASTSAASLRSLALLVLAADDVFESALHDVLLVDVVRFGGGSSRLLFGNLSVLLLLGSLGLGLGLELVIRVGSHVRKNILCSHSFETQCLSK